MADLPYYDHYAACANVHRLYAARAWHWRFWQLCYEGGPSYYAPDIPITWFWPTITEGENGRPDRITHKRGPANSFLWPYDSEERGDYDQRVVKANRVNLCRPIVDSYTSLVQSKPTLRTAGSAAILDEMWRDVDLRGLGIDAWMAEGITGAQVFGHMFAVMDVVAPNAGAGGVTVRSQADMRAAGVRPYAVWYTPLEVPDWETDAFGNFRWLTVCEPGSNDRPRPGAGDQATMRYRTWFVDHWEVKGEGTCMVCGASGVAESGAHDFGRVPVLVLYRKRRPGSVDPDGLTMLEDIAPADREIFNLMSHRQEMLYRQNFPFLVVPDPNREINRVDIGVGRLFAYRPQDGGGPPSFIAPPPECIRVVNEQIEATVLLIRAVSGLSRGVADQSIAARSGDALMIETQDRSAMVRQLAQSAQQFERELAALASDRMGVSFDGSVVYPDRYDVRSLGDDLEEVEKLLALGPTPLVRAEILMAVQARMLAHLPPERLAEIQRATAALGDAAPANQALTSVGLPAKAGPDGDLTLTELRVKSESVPAAPVPAPDGA